RVRRRRARRRRMSSDPSQLAREFVVFCDGLEASGAPGIDGYARRGRVVAGELLAALAELEAERSARCAIQDARDRAIAILARQAGDAMLPAAVRERARLAVERADFGA